MREIVVRLLERRARRRLFSGHDLNVDATARISYRRVVMQPGSKLTIGAGSIVEGSNLVFERQGGEIAIGRNTFIGGSLIACSTRVEIGDDVLVSWGCNIVDHNSHSIAWSKRQNDVRDWYEGRAAKDWSNVPIAPVRIGNKCWIGMNAIILMGVELGEGAVVGAGSVVTRSVPPWTVVVGNPARLMRELGPEER